jgi:hypothetical protein
MEVSPCGTGIECFALEERALPWNGDIIHFVNGSESIKTTGNKFILNWKSGYALNN